MMQSEFESVVGSPPCLSERYREIRDFSRYLCEPLSAEDCVIQSMPDVSPTRWHLAHTTWFFETFILSEHIPSYECFDDDFSFLFNSYYNQIGEQFPRAKRGLLSRPSVKQVWDYRRYVDSRMLELLSSSHFDDDSELAQQVVLGLNHEQQHQELMLTDMKHVLSCNPIFPEYRNEPSRGESTTISGIAWRPFEEGLYTFGCDDDRNAFDNESPRHRHFLHDFQIGSRLTTNGEFLEFMSDGGYKRPELWLSMGWHAVQENQWNAPMYWIKRNGEWFHFTLNGLKAVDESAPVCHVSYFEADAFARWSDKRLPTEFEWEHAANEVAVAGNFVESENWCPVPSDADSNKDTTQMFGDVWEWTSSQYSPFPGFKPAANAIGEYNGKFMCNQFVLRGGSCCSSQSHLRSTYRNFFPPDARWQFTGIRLAQ